MVWARALWTTVAGKNFPAFLLYGRGEEIIVRELSIFIDESGDFGEIKERPSYYLVTLVFHDQSNSISENVKWLEESVRLSGFNLEYIHTGPLIRREDIFYSFTIDKRRKLLYKLLNFINNCPI